METGVGTRRRGCGPVDPDDGPPPLKRARVECDSQPEAGVQAPPFSLADLVSEASKRVYAGLLEMGTHLPRELARLIAAYYVEGLPLRWTLDGSMEFQLSSGGWLVHYPEWVATFAHTSLADCLPRWRLQTDHIKSRTWIGVARKSKQTTWLPEAFTVCIATGRVAHDPGCVWLGECKLNGLNAVCIEVDKTLRTVAFGPYAGPGDRLVVHIPPNESLHDWAACILRRTEDTDPAKFKCTHDD